MSRQDALAALRDFEKQATKHERLEVYKQVALALIAREGGFSDRRIEVIAERLLASAHAFAVKSHNSHNGEKDEESIQGHEEASSKAGQEAGQEG